MSNFYLDIAKDRLYISSASEFRRRSCQTVMAKVLEAYAAVMAPILPHMAEDIWSNLPYAAPTKSIFQSGWPGNTRRTSNLRLATACNANFGVQCELRVPRLLTRLLMPRLLTPRLLTRVHRRQHRGQGHQRRREGRVAGTPRIT